MVYKSILRNEAAWIYYPDFRDEVTHKKKPTDIQGQDPTKS